MPDGATLIRPTNGHNSLQLRSNVSGQAQRPGKISGVYEYLTDDTPQEHFLWVTAFLTVVLPKLLVVTITRPSSASVNFLR